MPTRGLNAIKVEQNDEEDDELTKYFDEVNSETVANPSRSSGASKVVPVPSGIKTATVEEYRTVVAEPKTRRRGP